MARRHRPWLQLRKYGVKTRSKRRQDGFVMILREEGTFVNRLYGTVVLGIQGLQTVEFELKS